MRNKLDQQDIDTLQARLSWFLDPNEIAEPEVVACKTLGCEAPAIDAPHGLCDACEEADFARRCGHSPGSANFSRLYPNLAARLGVA